MRALQLIADREVRLVDLAPPPAPAPGEVQLRIRMVGLNHIDVWGWRGMAFAKRKLPFTVAPRRPARSSHAAKVSRACVAARRWCRSAPSPAGCAAPAARGATNR